MIRLLVIFCAVIRLHVSEQLRYSGRFRPNIIFIVADDLGYNDVGWRNRLIRTPNLDSLQSRNGTITLDQYYVMYVCTPSRAAFLTGYYPYHLGLQHYAIEPRQPKFLPGNVRLLPEYLKPLGYETHSIGKWHLGFCSWDKTPTYRGFDTFYGFYQGQSDYFSHSWAPENCSMGLDFRNNTQLVRDQNGTYSVNSFTNRAVDIIDRHSPEKALYMYLAYQNIHTPLQVPSQYLDISIRNEERRFTTAMMRVLDEGIGNITQALTRKNMFDDTVLVFTTDNGGRVDEGGNNWPLRGSKFTPWEGGCRGVGLIHYGMFTRHAYTGLFHAVDWVPTLVEAAGGPIPTTDGLSQWPHLLSGRNKSPRTEFVYNIDEIDDVGAIRVGDYKLIVGSTIGLNRGISRNGWYPPFNALTSSEGLQALKTADSFGDLVLATTGASRMKLFNLRNDPYERIDISKKRRGDITKALFERLQWYNLTRVPASYPDDDERADPKYWNGTWSPGWC